MFLLGSNYILTGELRSLNGELNKNGRLLM